MKHNRFIGVFLILAILYLPAPAQSQMTTGKVVGVFDGDTITVLDQNKRQHKVRLIGIDAPESKQDFGEVAKQHLSDLVFGKEVRMIGGKQDEYGLTPGKVMIGDRNINLEHLRVGLAWYYRHDAKDLDPTDREAYDRAESEAKTAKRGLWAQPNPVPPWKWRADGQVAKDAKPHGRPEAPEKVIVNSRYAGIVGNKQSKVYHLLGCPGYSTVSAENRVFFAGVEDAERAGYRKAENCSK